MKKTLILLLLIAFYAQAALAYRYAFDSIPDVLRSNANAVIRTDQMVCELLSPGRMKITYKRAITLLNKNADSYRSVDIEYDSYSRISSVSASVYDRNGKLIDVLLKSDIFDVDASGALASDQREKQILFHKYKFPYTIELEYTQEYNSVLRLPPWYFQDEPDVSVEQCGVQYIIPANMHFRYREYYLTNKVDSIAAGNKNIFTWVENNIPAYKKWYFTSLRMAQNPMVIASVDDFDYGRQKGSYTDWKSFGNWFYGLNKGLDELQPEEVQHIRSLVSGVSEDREKVRILYRYMQSKTRYVLVSFGLGGFKPFPASFVSEKGYGDCKGLSNYMHAILKAAGINSYYSLVFTGGHQDIVTDFVCYQFNHAILNVPLEKETIWLECTNQDMPFNYLTTQTSDRSALLITPEGGKLAKIPSIENNIHRTTGIIDVKRGGNTSGEVTEENHGSYYDESMGYLNKSEDEIKRSLNESLTLGTFNVTGAAFINNNDENPVSRLSYKLKIRNFVTSGLSYIYFCPSLVKMDYPALDTLGIRSYETTTMIDSITFNLPSGYEFVSVPENVDIRNEFGTFTRTLTASDGKITFQRQLVINKGRYNEEKSEGFYDFIRSVAIADHQKVVLKEKSS